MIPINDGQAAMKKINALLELKGIKPSEFARRMGVTSAYVSNWRRRGIPTDRLGRAADVLGVSVDDLMGRVQGMPPQGMAMLLTGHIPVVGHARLGEKFTDYAKFTEYDGDLPIPSRDPMAYALRCDGESMMPRIQPGEFVIAEPSLEADPGDEVVVQDTHDRVMVKRYLYWRDNRLYLGSINDNYPTVVLEADEVEHVHPVLAIVPKKLWNPPT